MNAIKSTDAVKAPGLPKSPVDRLRHLTRYPLIEERQMLLVTPTIVTAPRDASGKI
jgi:hypothetical protein